MVKRQNLFLVTLSWSLRVNYNYNMLKQLKAKLNSVFQPSSYVFFFQAEEKNEEEEEKKVSKNESFLPIMSSLIL